YYEKDTELKDILSKVEKSYNNLKEKGVEAIADLKKEADVLLSDLRHVIRWRKISPSTTLGGELPYKSRRSRL
ncbi:MAG: hypothetical protein ACXQTA_01470, partial [Candidatus Syntropharchaeales archaeon]